MIVSVFAVLSISACTSTQPSELGTSSLVKQRIKYFDYVGFAVDKTPSQYTSIYIADVALTFEPRWLHDNRYDVDQHYRARLAQEYGQALKDALGKAITRHEMLVLVDTPTPSTLIVQPQLIDVRVNGPDNNTLVSHLVNYAGDARLEVAFYAGDKLVAQLNDYRQTRDRSLFGPELTDRVRNYRDFSILMAQWSDRLVSAFW